MGYISQHSREVLETLDGHGELTFAWVLLKAFQRRNTAGIMEAFFALQFLVHLHMIAAYAADTRKEFYRYSACIVLRRGLAKGVIGN